MGSVENETETQVWIAGERVIVVVWTVNEMIYTRSDYKDTLIRLPHRSVLRLLEGGKLRIEGDIPKWVQAASDNTLH